MLRLITATLLFSITISNTYSQAQPGGPVENSSNNGTVKKKSKLLQILGNVAKDVITRAITPNTSTTPTNNSTNPTTSTTNTTTSTINPRSGNWTTSTSSTEPIQISTPVNNAFTPVNNAFTPVNNAFTPVNNAFTPVNNAFTPVKDAFTPVKDAFTPVNNAFTPVNNAFTPVENAFTPVKDAFSPVQLSTPVNNAFTPIENAFTPVQLSTPVNNAFTPVNNASTPVNNAFTPVNNAFTPVQLSTPVNNSFTAAQLSTPINNAFGSTQQLSTPVQMSNASGNGNSTQLKGVSYAVKPATPIEAPNFKTFETIPTDVGKKLPSSSKIIATTFFNGTSYYVDLEGYGALKEVWFRISKIVSSMKDIKIMTLSAAIGNVSNMSSCETLHSYEMGKTIAGCFSSAVATYCVVAKRNPGTLLLAKVFKCSATINYAISTGSGDCVNGVIKPLAHALGLDDTYISLFGQASIGKIDGETVITHFLEKKLCK